MRPTLAHSIVRQYLEVEVIGTEANALALQGTLAALCKESLLPVIELAFERCCPQHRLIRIERLELDLGSVALGRLEQELPTLLQHSLATALDAHIAALPPSPDGTAGYTGLAHAMDEALAYFLQCGTLPPALHLSRDRNFETTLRAYQDESGAGALAPLSNALQTALRRGAGIERLTGQFSVAFQRTILARMGTTALVSLDAVLGQVPAGPAIAGALAAIDTGHSQPYDANVLAAVEKLLLRAALHCAAMGGDSSAPALIGEALALAGGQRAAQAALKVMLTPAALAAQSNPEKPEHAATVDQAGLSSMPGMQSDCIDHPDQAEGIFVDNAGLVLLHPFLAPLFDTLAISRGERLLAPARALAVMHFLASGQDSGPEYAMALPKILCALPLTANVEAGIVTSAVEQAEAFEMLEAVITHWSKLQSTSPDGLRGAFLMRPGKLSQRNGEWVLQVEAHAADILLSDLPWGVSAIRLPWMEQILWVEWN